MEMNIEETIGDLPCHPDPEKQDWLRRKWACRLWRVCNEKWLPWAKFFQAAIRKHHVAEREEDLLRSVIHYTEFSDYLPTNAPELVAAAVANTVAPTPSWCKKSGEVYGRLWFAVLLLGANGRAFSFAVKKISDAFAIKSKNSVTRFIASAIKHGCLVCVREGISHPTAGKAALYRLAAQYQGDWQTIAEAHNLPWLSSAS